MLDIKFVDSFKEDSAAICVIVSGDLELSVQAASFDKKFGGIIDKALKAFDNFSGKFGQVKTLTVVSKNEKLQQVFLVGAGSDKDITKSKIEELGGIIANALKSSRCKNGFIEAIKLGKYEDSKVAARLASGVMLNCYSFDKYFTTKKPEELNVLKHVEVFSSDNKKSKEKFIGLKAVCEAVHAARDLISEPANVLYPESYSEIIKNTLEPLDVKVEILGEREMKNLGMHSLLGVGQGSTRESKLVVMSYFGKDEESAPVALVGKGVTFDTGGISIKPSFNMGKMKYDMSGSAAVFGTIMALAKRKSKANVVGIVGLVENMPGGNAQRPGDVVKSMSGKTIEVLDTDAEGRLVLADALWYAQDRFKPSIMVDLATLTGAITIALGDTYAGMYSNSDDLAEQLIKAGKSSGEELWRMPLHSNYNKMIKSDIADVANISSPRGSASSNTAAQFLQHFVNKVSWAHLDIAGVADNDRAKNTCPKGSVGFGIRLLNKLIKENYEE